MGWDAFAHGPKGGRISDPKIINSFKRASAKAKRLSGATDIHIIEHVPLRFLTIIVVDCSDSAKMLEKATNRSAWDYNLWHPSKMTANWNFVYENSDAWAYWSARLFFETCQRHNLTIKFSW